MDCDFFYHKLSGLGIRFFTGVPDSLLAAFCDYVTEHARSEDHIIAANEGGAVALACGHYLATGRAGLVYMQNSGQGNAANPLISLADCEVYSIPMLLLIGWRGEPGSKDEPQHIKQGKITLSFLDTLGIPYRMLSAANTDAGRDIEQSFETMQELNGPVALIARKGTFSPCQALKHDDGGSELAREEAIREIIRNLTKSDIVVSTTGKISRELYEYREAVDCDHSRDFLTVGSMGHASQIAMAIAAAKPQRDVFVLDGDGAAIMHMGAMAIAGASALPNFKHVILNNGCHDSVGGHPTAGSSISFTQIAKGCGYKRATEARTLQQVRQQVVSLKESAGPALLEVRVKKGSRENLGRPKTSPWENKAAFMRFLAN